MALVLRKALFDRASSLIDIKRFRGKINFKKPKPPHFQRTVYMELTKPYFVSPNKDKTPIELCWNIAAINKKDEDNPLQRIIAGELRSLLKTSRLVAFYHKNPISAEEEFKTFVRFKRANMYFKMYGKKTMEMAVKDTRFEPILDFFCSHNMLAFSPEPNIQALLKATKRVPQLILLAAILEGQLISKDELTKYSLIPNLQTAQAEFVQTLNAAGSNLVSQLATHQNVFITQLEERRKQLEEVEE